MARPSNKGLGGSSNAYHAAGPLCLTGICIARPHNAAAALGGSTTFTLRPTLCSVHSWERTLDAFIQHPLTFTRPSTCNSPYSPRRPIEIRTGITVAACTSRHQFHKRPCLCSNRKTILRVLPSPSTLRQAEVIMSLAAGPGRGRTAEGQLPEELKLVVDKHVAYIQSLDEVRPSPTIAASESVKELTLTRVVAQRRA